LIESTRNRRDGDQELAEGSVERFRAIPDQLPPAFDHPPESDYPDTALADIIPQWTA